MNECFRPPTELGSIFPSGYAFSSAAAEGAFNPEEVAIVLSLIVILRFAIPGDDFVDHYKKGRKQQLNWTKTKKYVLIEVWRLCKHSAVQSSTVVLRTLG